MALGARVLELDSLGESQSLLLSTRGYPNYGLSKALRASEPRPSSLRLRQIEWGTGFIGVTHWSVYLTLAIKLKVPRASVWLITKTPILLLDKSATVPAFPLNLQSRLSLAFRKKD